MDARGAALAAGAVRSCCRGVTVLVRLPQVLRLYADGNATVEAHGSTVAAVLDALVSEYPGVVRRVRDEQGRIRQHVNIFVGDERAVLDTPVKDGQEVTILPAISGGGCILSASPTV